MPIFSNKCDPRLCSKCANEKCELSLAYSMNRNKLQQSTQTEQFASVLPNVEIENSNNSQQIDYKQLSAILTSQINPILTQVNSNIKTISQELANVKKNINENTNENNDSTINNIGDKLDKLVNVISSLNIVDPNVINEITGNTDVVSEDVQTNAVSVYNPNDSVTVLQKGDTYIEQKRGFFGGIKNVTKTVK